MQSAGERVVGVALAMIVAAMAPSQADDAQAPGAAAPFLVEVNGERLLKADVDRALGPQVRGMTEEAKRRFSEYAYRQRIQDFITRVLLLAEADARGVRVTEEEAMKAYSTRLPRGVSVEEFVQRQEADGKDPRTFMLEEARIERLKALLAQDLTFSPEEIAAYHEGVTESVRARHILIKARQEEAAEVKAEAREKAASVRQQILDGADFAEMARLHSDCPSKAKGGELGSFTRGRMVKPFEDAAFAQDVQEIGPVIETSFGYHVIQVLEHVRGETLSRDDVVLALREQKAEEMADELLAELKEKAVIRYPR